MRNYDSIEPSFKLLLKFFSINLIKRREKKDCNQSTTQRNKPVLKPDLYYIHRYARTVIPLTFQIIELTHQKIRIILEFFLTSLPQTNKFFQPVSNMIQIT